MIRDKIWHLFKRSPDGSLFTYKTDIDGLLLLLEPEVYNAAVLHPTADLLLSHQLIYLKSLEEQGLAEKIANGWLVETENAIRMDDDFLALFSLPERFNGHLNVSFTGTTTQSSFQPHSSIIQNGDEIHSFKLDGPLLSLSKTEQYSLNAAQWYGINSLLEFSESDVSERNEFLNNELIYKLQKAEAGGLGVTLGHFEDLSIYSPDKISIAVEQTDTGDLNITPMIGGDIAADEIKARLSQLAGDSHILRVNNKIVLFEPEQFEAIENILENKKIPADQAQQFFETPTAFISASLVDLDVGFSYRVKGVALFKHAYFGEQETSSLNWFDKLESDLNPRSLLNMICDPDISIDEKKEIIKLADEARDTGADVIDFAGVEVLVGTIEEADEVSQLMEKNQFDDNLEDMDATETGGTDTPAKEEKEASEAIVVDILLNDEKLEADSEQTVASLEDLLVPEGSIDWSNFKRKPYKHQIVGVRWLLGLAKQEAGIFGRGGILADDMGLGKTFVALAGIEQYYASKEAVGDIQKPVLIVAPLSLLQNWKDEVDLTFKESPFDDIVILQSSGELNKYKIAGRKRETEKQKDQDTVRYALKVGSDYFSDRLDVNRRLVITTYQTLRDYQFSLCRVHWSFVVFDEAQNIKNPNTIQSRAAKGLNAEFKLIATGTPVENALVDFWCLVDTASPGLLGEYQDFKEKYVRPILTASSDEKDEISEMIGKRIREDVGQLMLRRLKEDNLEGLPKKYIYVGGDFSERTDDREVFSPELKSTMVGLQLDTYNSVIHQVKAKDKVAIAALHELRDISLHPSLSSQGQLNMPKTTGAVDDLVNSSPKLVSMLRCIDEIKNKQEKVIIFCINKRLQRFLASLLSFRFGIGLISIINGDTKAVSKKADVSTRKTIISDFEEVKGFNVIIMSPIAAGVGLTVVGANHVIHFERHWNPAKEAQATDRIYRIGQEKDVHIHLPIAHHPDFESFDVNLHKLLSSKTSLKDAVIAQQDVVPRPDFEDVTVGNVGFPELNQMPWQKFEAFSAEVLRHYFPNIKETFLTRSGPDHGADVVFVDDNGLILVQCKHKSDGGTLASYKAINEIAGAIGHYENKLNKRVHTKYLVTNARSLVKQGRQAAKDNNVNLFMAKDIEEFLDRVTISHIDVLDRLHKKRLH